MRRFLPLVLLFAAVATALNGQQRGGLQFEVASVKYAGPYNSELRPLRQRGGPGTTDPERLSIENATMIGLLGQAYSTPFDLITGPDWLGSEVYTIEAKLPLGVDRPEMNEMLRGLLTQRFGLLVHHETRSVTSYALEVLVRDKLKASSGSLGEAPAGASRRPTLGSDGFPVLPPGLHRGARTEIVSGEKITRITYRGFTMQQFAAELAWPLGDPRWEHVVSTARVADRTGLTGTYDFRLEFSGYFYPGGAFPQPGDTVQERHAPTLFEAVEQQLGLKLVQRKLPADILVVDRLERVPTAN